MKNMIKLGLLSTLLSATLLADVKIESSALSVDPMRTSILFKLTDTETNEPIIKNVDFSELSVGAGAKIDGMRVIGEGDYLFNIISIAGCNKSANPEIKGVFSTSIKGIKGKKVQVPYTLCKENRTHFSIGSPYKNNEKKEKVLFAKNNVGEKFGGGYILSIGGDTEANYDFLTLTDKSGKVLEADVYDLDSNTTVKKQKLRFSGKFNKEVFLKGPESGLEVKVTFTSDGSVTKNGAVVDMDAAIAAVEPS